MARASWCSPSVPCDRGKPSPLAGRFYLYTRMFAGQQMLDLICLQSPALFFASILPELRRFAEADGKICTYSIAQGMLYIGRPLKEGSRQVADDDLSQYLVVAGSDYDTHHRLMGSTIHCILFEEVTLVHPDFLSNALGRLSFDSSKGWLQCNPATPLHWLKTDYIDTNVFDQVLNFLFEDNPFLTERVKERLRRIYVPGTAAYDRYVLGLWVAAEGAVYRDYHTFDLADLVGLREGQRIRRVFLGHDHGASRDPAVFVPVAEVSPVHQVEGALSPSRYLVLDPLTIRHDEETEITTDSWIVRKCFDWLLEGFGRSTPITFVRDVAPVAANFAKELRFADNFRNLNLRLTTSPRDVLGGIRIVTGMLATGEAAIASTAVELLKEIDGYMWDAAKIRDERPEDGDDHHCDALRYALGKTRSQTAGHLEN